MCNNLLKQIFKFGIKKSLNQLVRGLLNYNDFVKALLIVLLTAPVLLLLHLMTRNTAIQSHSLIFSGLCSRIIKLGTCEQNEKLGSSSIWLS